MKMPSPWTRDRRGRRYWYLTLDGQQTLLGSCQIDDPTYAEVVDRVRQEYGKLIANYDPKVGRQTAAKVSKEYVLTVRALAASFLEWAESNLSDTAFGQYQRYVRQFARSVPDGMLVEELKPHHVISFASDELGHLGPTTRFIALSIIKRCFNWGAEVGFYEHSPIAKLKKPTPQRREALVTPEERDKLLTKAKQKGDFQDLILVMIDHGLRPVEIRTISANHVDLSTGLVEIPAKQTKTGKRTGRGRSIWLTEQTRPIFEKLIAKYPQGPLFRNSKGGAWTKDALCRCVARLKEETKITRPISLYSFRHGYGTNGLIAEVDPSTIAASMGHSNAAMLLKVYSHVATVQSHMKNAAEKLAAANRGTSQLGVDVQARPKHGKASRKSKPVD